MYIAPRMAGILVKVFAWFLESKIFGTLLLYILKGNNMIHKVRHIYIYIYSNSLRICCPKFIRCLFKKNKCVNFLPRLFLIRYALFRNLSAHQVHDKIKKLYIYTWF